MQLVQCLSVDFLYNRCTGEEIGLITVERWSTDELQDVDRLWGHLINSMKWAKKKDVTDLIDQSPSLSKRGWKKIKYKINYRINQRIKLDKEKP